MITLLQNPRCSKSREALSILENENVEFEILSYLDGQLDTAQIKNIIAKLNIKPIDLVRKNESIWKENFRTKKHSDDEIITILSQYPKLIERPIIINGNTAIIGRPPQRIHEIL